VITPVRIRLSRRAGFNLQAQSIALNGLPARVVARTTRHGNPYRVLRDTSGYFTSWKIVMRDRTIAQGFRSERDAAARAVELFRTLLRKQGVRRKAARELRGLNVACWCELCSEHAAGKPLGVVCAKCAPCHADVLLETANARAS